MHHKSFVLKKYDNNNKQISNSTIGTGDKKRKANNRQQLTAGQRVENTKSSLTV
jgi:hypothetical protein